MFSVFNVFFTKGFQCFSVIDFHIFQSSLHTLILPILAAGSESRLRRTHEASHVHQNAAKMERDAQERFRLQRCEGVCLSKGPAERSLLGEHIDQVGMWVDNDCICVDGSILLAVHVVSRPTMLTLFISFPCPLSFRFESLT